MTNIKTQQRFDDIYKNTPLGEIPWNHEKPPEPLVDLVNSGEIKPCRALDLGCGAGNYAVYLASCGFEVTAIDISPAAIKIAKKIAKQKGVACSFLVADVLEDFPQFDKPFDFIYDWGLLHHIPPRKRKKYIADVHHNLQSEGLYLSLCFNEKDTCFEGTGKTRKSNRKTTIYLSSEAGLKRLFSPLFKLLDFRIIHTQNFPYKHVFNFALLQRY